MVQVGSYSSHFETYEICFKYIHPYCTFSLLVMLPYLFSAWFWDYIAIYYTIILKLYYAITVYNIFYFRLFCMSQIPDGDVDPVDHPKKSDILPNLFVIQKEVNHVRQSSSFNSNRDDPHGE